MSIARIGYGIAYFIILIYNILKSALNVARMVLTGGIQPVVVEIETILERPISQTILANSITLTPGTLSIDLDSEKGLLKVATIIPKEKKEIIPFEPYIKKMLE
ncbi:MAG TPA: Na+/H+ antiporter subunit E [Methanothermobacter sp.]|nr:multisubunit Na+/H+ antiporter, MnhE subunit [Methanothermobacter sp. MT-2]HHW04845.1 cation:proton antiporter [Methanothermobacter sp.]HOK72145.1 Na+/H+ antiporter subunit E [Methanothermobacter sp.]HOL68458.1 Na+/H+ antiporter subunit E [Methanothermobacter sp.]HPQ04216.1 Na+/H+ antiporter subunit E [Methanothermobacter sp.]